MQHQIKFYIKSVSSFLIKKFIVILISVNYKKIITTTIQTDIALYFSFTWQRKLNIHFLDFFFGRNKNLLQCFQGFSSDKKKFNSKNWLKGVYDLSWWNFLPFLIQRALSLLPEMSWISTQPHHFTPRDSSEKAEKGSSQ